MKSYEKFIVKLEKPTTVYFYLKNLGYSENYIKNLRKNYDGILLNGQFVTLRARLSNNDILQISNSCQPKTKIPASSGKLDIVFEDNDFLIVNKPHGIACMPSRSHYHENLGGQICAYMQTKDQNFVLRILNRLDKDTAGLVVVAKNVLACNNISLEKEYHAICHGTFETHKFAIDKPILTKVENGINVMKRVVSPLGKPAITHVKVLKIFDNLSLLSLTLETGRTHQIRVHLSSIGHPLLGDKLYGESTLTHTFLVLKKIRFQHFKTGKLVEFEIPYPNDWKDFLPKK